MTKRLNQSRRLLGEALESFSNNNRDRDYLNTCALLVIAEALTEISEFFSDIDKKEV